MKKLQLFDKNHELYPLEKCHFCGFLKPMFSLFRKACLIYKTSIIVFSQFIFAIYDMRIQGITRGYWELQRITGGFKGLQGNTRGYRGLQGVTKGYKGLQGVTRGYRGLQEVTGGYKGLQGVTGGYKK